MSSFLSSSQSSAGQKQRPVPKPACPVLVFWKSQPVPGMLTASASMLARQCGTNSQRSWSSKLSAIGDATRHQLFWGYTLGITQLWENVDLHPCLQLGGGVNSLVNNEVQKTDDEWLVKQSLKKKKTAEMIRLRNNQSVCITLNWLFPPRTCCTCISRRQSLRDSFLNGMFMISIKVCNKR